jgi:AmiR/NasT family two-component response regulator
MERHGVSDKEAFEMLRSEARSNNRRVYDVADEIPTRAGGELSPKDAGPEDPRS